MPIFYCEIMTSFLNYVTATLRALFAWCGSYNKSLSFIIVDKKLDANSDKHKDSRMAIIRQ